MKPWTAKVTNELEHIRKFLLSYDYSEVTIKRSGSSVIIERTTDPRKDYSNG